MLLFKSLVTLSVMALGVATSPIKGKPGPWCDGWSDGYDNHTGFTLTAYNLTAAFDPNAVGYPLVLGSTGVVDGVSFNVLSTVASYPFGNPNQTWILSSGALLPNNISGANLHDGPVSAGQEPSWISNDEARPSTQQWCAIPQTRGRGNPSITLNGDINRFSLCKRWDSPDSQVDIVYEASPDAPEYIYKSCFAVAIEIVGGKR